MSRDIYALDVETAARDARHASYAGLEPWRVRHGTAHITSLSVARPDGSVKSLHRRGMGDTAFEMAVEDTVDELRGQVVYCHNAVFDVAWIIATIAKKRGMPVPESVKRVKWHDSMLLAKWVANGQYAEDVKFSYALWSCVETFLKAHPLCEEFLRMKAEKVVPGENDIYWERRNQMDVIMTRELAVLLESKLYEASRNGYVTEARNIVPVANAWINGIRVDQVELERVERSFQGEQMEILRRIQLHPSVLTSPKQLGELLFRKLRIDPVSLTPSGNPSTNADDLKIIAFKMEQNGQKELASFMRDVCQYKQIATLLSKYVKGAKLALEHTGDGYMYGSPRIFGTYTGRFTYYSTTLDEWQTAIALHQIPRKDKDIRRFLVPPEGFKVGEADAAGQESRLMAIRSNDPTMLDTFSQGKDLHGMSGSFIVGMEYEHFMEAYKSGDLKAVERRQMGKLTNLSCNFRTGGRKLASKAFSDYDMNLSVDTGNFLVNTWQKRYSQVPVYWDESIQFAKANGFTQAFGGRRYKVHHWDEDHRWQSESSALMFPIQSGGASMKNIAIAELFDKVPDAPFALDLHDASFFWLPEDRAAEVLEAVSEVLHSIDYKRYWGFEPPIALPYDVKLGNSFAEVK